MKPGSMALPNGTTDPFNQELARRCLVAVATQTVDLALTQEAWRDYKAVIQAGLLTRLDLPPFPEVAKPEVR